MLQSHYVSQKNFQVLIGLVLGYDPGPDPDRHQDYRIWISIKTLSFYIPHIPSSIHYTVHLGVYPMQWHRVGRVLSFSPVVGIGTPPTPQPQASVPPPLWFRGGGTLAGERGGGRVPKKNSEEGTYTVVLFIYMYFVDLDI